MSLSKNILDFLFHLKMPFDLPEGVEVLDAHKDKEVRDACSAFYKKFYNDDKPRHIMMGINPGRFGGGITGIPFTDPIRLENNCSIANDFQKKQELSSVFIYDMIEAFGGAKKFYSRVYITAISPLGFVKNGKNLNYYDDKLLKQLIEPFVVDCMNKQLSWGLKSDVCFCIGEGENLAYFNQLNQKYQWFKEIKSVPHPRFIMQYKLKQKEEYIERYIAALQAAIN